MKNYVGFVNDHSSSMSSLRTAAIADRNANVAATKDAATAEMLDTVVSVVGFGYDYHPTVRREVVISNPHVLKPVTTWACEGMTPLYDGVMEMITLFESLPDAADPNVSFLLIITTDGGENDSRTSASVLKEKIVSLLRTDRWTFTFRVPKGRTSQVSQLGVSAGNIQEWETTAAGMERVQAQTTTALRSFYSGRTAGAKSSSTFYTTAEAINTQALNDVSKSVQLYTVGQKPDDFDGMQIKDFILARRQQYYIGAAFYQLMKMEPRVTPTKLILIREKDTGKVYAGAEARKMIGLDTVNNARLHPQHGGSNIDIFIQSESVNRKLGMGHSVLYWQEKGRPMTQADIDKYAAKPVVPAVPVLAEAPKPGESTKSTIPVTKKAPATHAVQVGGKYVFKTYETREDARQAGRANRDGNGKVRFVQDARDFRPDQTQGLNGKRWFLFA